MSAKVVVVTGGTRGIGYGLVKELIARGCKVAFCGRTDESVAKALAALAAPEEQIVGVTADVTDPAALQGLWDIAVEDLGPVDVWINNAGVSAPKRNLVDLDWADVTTTVRINLEGVLAGSKVALAGFLGQGHGQLWNMEGYGSDGMTSPGISVYGSTKRAVTYLTKALVKETKGTPVQVCWLSPGIVATDLLVGDYDGQPEALAKAQRIFNILGDRVETVTPWLVDGILGTDKTGTRVAWLTRGKATRRFLGAFVLRRKRDIFT